MHKYIRLIFTLTLVLWAASASAGTLSVRDSTGWIPSGDVATLRSEAAQWPFDVHVLVENAPSFHALEGDAHSWTDSGSMTIAIDPSHHKTVVRFGNGTGVKAGDFDSISAAGNANFRSHEVRQGLEAIVARAQASRESSVAMSQSNAPVTVVRHEGLGFGAWLLIVLGFFALCGFVVWLVRRHNRDRRSFERALDENRLETSELLSRNVDQMTLPDASYAPAPSGQYAAPSRSYSSPAYVPPPAPVYVQQPPVIVHQGGGGDFLTGVLVGEALSEPHRREVYVEREVVREEPVYHESSHSQTSDDSGGSSSSWDSGSSDIGSSSWDSGSSFDSGSSGGDFGGGSSDW